MTAPLSAIVTDIEGTVTPIAFVRDVLFPYAAAHLDQFLADKAHTPDVAALLAEVASLAPHEPPAAALRRWMAEDEKIPPLKALQGLIWHQGYATGALRAPLYPDVAPALRAWRGAGLTLAVYSSGSVPAQKLLFAHTPCGDLTGLFDGFFDTRSGAKTHPESYRAIAAALRLEPARCLFLSDAAAELDAAAAAGLRCCQILRPADATTPAARHAQASSFADIALAPA